MSNILLLWDRVGDYHRARCKALQKEYTTLSEVSTTQNTHIFTADLGASDHLYQWQNTLDDQHFQLSSKPVTRFDFFTRLWNLYKIIKKHHIKVIGINGYGKLEYPFIIFLSKIAGIKTILFAESWYHGHPLVDKIKSWFLQKTIHGFLVSGKLAHTHFNHRLGIPATKIKTGYSAVDNQHFANIDNKITPIRPTLLCVARFAPEKNLDTLIKAFQQSDLSGKWQLKLVGGGPLKQELIALANQQPAIIFSDWLSYQELPALYHAASLFILPSTFEPWGLVVNEALAAGKPVIISQQCGCHPELVDTSNGFTFDAYNITELVDILNQLPHLTPDQLQSMSLNSLRKIQSLTPQTWAQHFLSLLH